MKDLLAERLLAKILGWTPEEVAAERPLVQALAAYKYDEYEQFSTGSRFIENLALWLNQFQTGPERRTAYQFVKTRLVFCSAAELRHLVDMAYPDHIRPISSQYYGWNQGSLQAEGDGFHVGIPSATAPMSFPRSQ